MARLRRVDCAGPGIRRNRGGRGFVYLRPDGSRIKDTAELRRIKGLAIPPAWEDVWICPDPLGHLQAVGVDSAGRRQYLYHPEWRARRDQQKFDRMLDFARALPKLRRRYQTDLRRGPVSRERVLAASVKLLDEGIFRMGGEAYADTNESYGLATLMKRHVQVKGKKVTFDYRSKGGQRLVFDVSDPALARLLERLKQRRGGSKELLAYREDGRWVDIKSADINAYVKEATGGEFTAKDFRTWSGTVMAALTLADQPPAESRAAKKRAVSAAVREVADHLGNTPAVASRAYVDPRVIDRYRSGWIIKASLKDQAAKPNPRLRARLERAVLDLLQDNRDSDELERTA